MSFLPQAEAEGEQFHDVNGAGRPGLEILRDHGYGWVRLRVFVQPKTLPNDLAYTLAEAKRAKALGFGLVLDLHYSDDWADPAHNNVPAAWAKLSHAALVEAGVCLYAGHGGGVSRAGNATGDRAGGQRDHVRNDVA